MTLAQLRELVGFSQDDVGRGLYLTQGAVSRMEKRPPKVSDLRAYVEILGGKLELRVRLRDGTEHVLDVPSGMPFRQGRRGAEEG